MKKPGKFILFTILIFCASLLPAQVITVPSYSACPNQVVNVTVTWNNVSNATYTLNFLPAAGPGTVVANTFTISAPAGPVNYQVTGIGTNNNGTLTSTGLFNLTIDPPPAMTLTNTGLYCYGTSAQIIAPSGGTTYTVLGGCSNITFQTNVITLPNMGPSCVGQYTVITNVGGCVLTGTTNIDVAPNNLITINTPSNVCSGDLNTSVLLTASMPSATNWVWLDNFNAPLPNNGSPFYTITAPLTVNQGGVYTVNADINYNNGTNSILCPRTATTQVNVVQTNPVTVPASPITLCQGSNLNLSATAGGASGWSWTGPQSFFSTVQNPIISQVTPVNSGVYVVTAFFAGSFLVCTNTAAINVQVVGVTQPVITMPSNFCQNFDAQAPSISMTVTAGNNPQLQGFTWLGPGFPSSGVIGSNAILPAPIVPGYSGTYYVSAKFSANNINCIATASAALNVVPVNTVTVIPPGQICTPTNANLQAFATGANGFQWVGPNGFASPGSNAIVYYPTPAASGIYTVTAFFGGSNITCTSSSVVQLTVHPVLNFSLIPRQQMCYNTPVTVTGPVGATSYSWTSSTGFTSNDKDISFPAILPKNAGTYTLNVALGPCITAQETIIEVLTPITLTLTPDSKRICRGDTIILEGGATGGSQNYAYEWNPGVYLDSPNGPKKVSVPQGSVFYNMIVHDIACPNYTVSHSFSITVDLAPLPKLEFTRAEGCAPMEILLNSKTQKEAAITTYDFGGLRKMQGDSFPYILDEPGIYWLKVYSKGKNGCSGTYNYPYPFVVNPSPGSDFYLDPEFPTTSDEITFKPVSKYDPIIRHSWQFLGGIDPKDTSAFKIKAPGTDTSNVKEPVRRYDLPNRYPVMLVTENDKGCIDTIVKFIPVIDDLRIYVPNTFTPNDDGINDLFFVKGMGIKYDNFSLEVTDRWGNQVFFSRDINQGWDGVVRGEKTRDGTYIYHVKVVGMNGEGRREFTGYVNVIK